MQPVARVRRGAVALAAASVGLSLAASPAAAQPWVPTPTPADAGSAVWVGISNGGPDPVQVEAVAGTQFVVSVTSGCTMTPPMDVQFAVCLPGGGYLGFASSLAVSGGAD
jgi:hypothetical protein